MHCKVVRYPQINIIKLKKLLTLFYDLWEVGGGVELGSWSKGIPDPKILDSHWQDFEYGITVEDAWYY